MGKRGPKAKQGKREANGRLSRNALSVADRLNDANAEARKKALAVVLAQPHRRGSEDNMCASALGRFVMAQGLRSEVYDAGNAYADLITRWRAAKGIPTSTRMRVGGVGDGPSAATVKAWAIQIGKIELEIVDISHAGFLAMRRLTLDDEDIPSVLWPDAVLSLGALAIAMGRLPSGGHPFLSGRDS